MSQWASGEKLELFESPENFHNSVVGFREFCMSVQTESNFKSECKCFYFILSEVRPKYARFTAGNLAAEFWKQATAQKKTR